MHYTDETDIARLTTAGDISALDPESGRILPMNGASAVLRTPTMDVETLRTYSGQRQLDHNIEHMYVHDPISGIWSEYDTYQTTPLTLTPRDFRKRPARSGDRLTHEANEENKYKSAFDGMSLQDMLTDERFKNRIIEQIIRQYPPAYDERAKRSLAERLAAALPSLDRQPMRGQADAILASTFSVENRRGTNLVGEMGCGKTTIAIIAALLAGMRLVVVVCPRHLLHKWRREVLATVPGAKAYIIEGIRPDKSRRSAAKMDLATLEKTILRRKADGTLKPHTPIYAIVPSTMASLSHAGEGVGFKRKIYSDPTNTRPVAALDPDGNRKTVELPRLGRVMRTIEETDRWGRKTTYTQPASAICCPDCFTHALDERGALVENPDVLWKKRMKCRRCGAPLWSARRLTRDSRADIEQMTREAKKERARKPVAEWSGLREQRWSGKTRYALGDYITKYLKTRFDMMIADEVHEYKGKGTARGIIIGNMSRAAKKTLTLTGTLMGGYSSNLFYILQRFGDELLGEFAYSDEKKWVQRFGFEQTIKKKEPSTRYNTHSRGFVSTTTRERPGLSPLALPLILSNSSFIRLFDVTDELPPYRESVRLIELDNHIHTGDKLSQASAYKELENGFKSAIASLSGSSKAISLYMHSLLAYPDNPVTKEEAVSEDGDLIASAPALADTATYPKEAEIVSIAREQRDKGLPTMVLVNYTSKRDITPRIAATLEAHGLSVRVLRSSVDSEKREAVIDKWVAQGTDVVISHPGLIQTGLDLIDFPTIVWYQPTYSTYTMRQASRRSWRIGQKRPVDVIHLIYSGTMQERALDLIARKAQASMAVEGELPEDGLASYGDSADNIHLELAKSLVEGQAPSTMATDMQRLLDANATKNIEDETQLTSDAWSQIEAFTLIRENAEDTPSENDAPSERPRITELDLAIFTDLASGLDKENTPSLFSSMLN